MAELRRGIGLPRNIVRHGLPAVSEIGGLDRATAFFAAFPVGLIEAAILGREAGGDERLISVLHFLRVSLIVLFVPLVF